MNINQPPFFDFLQKSKAAEAGVVIVQTTISSTIRSRRVDEYRFGAQFLETEVHGPTQSPGSMSCHGRNCHTLPGPKAQLPIVSQIYGKAPAYNDEHLVGGGVIVPAVCFIECSKPQTAVIDAADDHVPVRLSNRRAFGR